jgi:hypothetical protein
MGRRESNREVGGFSFKEQKSLNLIGQCVEAAAWSPKLHSGLPLFALGRQELHFMFQPPVNRGFLADKATIGLRDGRKQF